ncbi:hypothetical protein N7513_007625 [Penicillium frequentans]|nr:hypothetical protein N7513_007625 [Penicillium glabrum]
MNPRVGVAVFVVNQEGKFVIGKRKGSHGAGTWALPGGHLEFGESFEECAKRELVEETGLDIIDLEFLTATNDIMKAEEKHYITIYMKGVISDVSPQLQLREPEKCDGWEWISWDELRAQAETQISLGSESPERILFSPLIALFQQRPDIRV